MGEEAQRAKVASPRKPKSPRVPLKPTRRSARKKGVKPEYTGVQVIPEYKEPEFIPKRRKTKPFKGFMATKGSKALCALMAAGVIEPGRGVISVRGRTGSVSADLTAKGLIIYKGSVFQSPSGFAKNALELGRRPGQPYKCNGWTNTLYRMPGSPVQWRTLDFLRPTCV